MVFISPDDSVMRMLSMYRWQRDWINKNRQVNWSGLFQDIVIEVMKEHDPEYFEKNKHRIGIKLVKKKDVIEQVKKTIDIQTYS